MGKTTFERKVRYCALRDIAADLLEHKLLTLGEYYTILSLLSQRYLKGGQNNAQKNVQP